MAFDTSHIKNLPEGLDPEIVKQTQQGKHWGAQDQHRYDIAVGKKKSGAQVREMRSQGNLKDNYQQLVDHKSSGGTLGGVAQRQMNNMGERLEKRSEAKDRAQNYQANDTNIKNTQTQTVSQDNDQTSSVQGDKNYVYQNQDNSIRNYGGDNRSFVYNSNSEGPDTPATMATLAGYYAPDDSPSARASRLDQNVTMNRDNQKKYANTSHIAQGAISRAENSAYIDPAKMDQRIQEREKYSRAKSTVMAGNIFGDMFNMKTPDWKSADPAKPVKSPDFEKMYDKYTDF